jgi:hypothetical protein
MKHHGRHSSTVAAVKLLEITALCKRIGQKGRGPCTSSWAERV